MLRLTLGSVDDGSRLASEAPKSDSEPDVLQARARRKLWLPALLMRLHETLALEEIGPLLPAGFLDFTRLFDQAWHKVWSNCLPPCRCWDTGKTENFYTIRGDIYIYIYVGIVLGQSKTLKPELRSANW